MYTRLDYIEKETSILLRKKKYFEHHIKRVKNDEDKEKLFCILFAITVRSVVLFTEYVEVREEALNCYRNVSPNCNKNQKLLH